MEKELLTIISNNNYYHDEFFSLQFKEFENILNKNFSIDNKTIKEIPDIKNFVISYFSKFENCLLKLFNISSNSDFNELTNSNTSSINKNFTNLLLKIYQDFICNKFIKLVDIIINDIYNNYENEKEAKIKTLTNTLNKLSEEINNNKILLEEKNKEKSTVNRNYLELETKFDKFNRENKIKLKEFENNINIEKEKYKKMELYYLNQIKEKENLINTLENKVQKCSNDLNNTNKENMIKINELNRQNKKLSNEINRLGGIGSLSDKYKGNMSDFNMTGLGGLGVSVGGVNVGSDSGSNNKNMNFNNIATSMKNIQNYFIEFKDSVDKLNKENENVLKNKYLENSKQEIENKLNNCIIDIKAFCDGQIKNVSDNYEKIIKKTKDQLEELNFELSKKNFVINEQIQLKETFEKKFNESNKTINELKDMIQSKKDELNTRKDAFDIYEKQIVFFKKQKEDVELSLAKNIYNFRMKEDEFDTLLAVTESIISRKKDTYQHNVNKLSNEAQNYLQSLIKKYKFFK